MRNFRDFLSKFEGLLAAARKKAGSHPGTSATRTTRLRELTGFGANPGKLRMFAYAPEALPHEAPLVIALHGCTQTAAEYDQGTGWSSLADNLGFAVVYPQQQPANNPKNCFSWFLPADIARGHGEALSIREMVEHAIATFGIDRRKVFVTGLSAGGAMASVMLATYPEVFAGGAIVAGLPYGCASNIQQAFEAMFTENGHAAQALGDRVRAASGHRGPWPKISVWHGTCDAIVNPCNGESLIRQWTNVHGLSEIPARQESVEGHTRRVWTDANGEALIEAFSISGMAHGVPLATTKDGCGSAGAFFLDAGISSTHHIARFWRLHESLAVAPRAAPPVPASVRIPTKAGSVVVVAAPAEDVHGSARGSHAEGQEHQNRYPVDPNAVIAAAFKAAGLPVPEIPAAAPGTHSAVAPGPIIAAALKAAGLT
ncbi:PHB depolymerase family esterase [Bradyrhizobium sp. CB1650]|uniref:extracellular catalytic domain type 1 short-chain-length polyhydroxyalkanoate depolymerase n=1 Tax=Bradyrhizobium sp. CB1650 TaxID=3039153 RepID=UPI0024348CB6|nr:PHB depolymerase family esterase [Bradyrhizobium sp. CB1650]WGD55047.1 PHB depolymerase family esterase [Bradyrhizobium sp. CB1650]